MQSPQVIDGDFTVLGESHRKGVGQSAARIAQWVGVVVAVVVLRLAAAPLFNLVAALDHALFGWPLIHH